MADHASVPVINGLTNRTHPCQIMADILTFEEHRGPIAGKKVTWCGDGNNVFASFAHAAGQFGFDLTFSGPPPLDPERVFLDEARAKGATIEIERDPAKAVAGADLVVTDTLGVHGMTVHSSPVERRPTSLPPLPGERGADETRQARALVHALPCLPTGTKEVTDAVIDGPQLRSSF